MGGAGGAGFRRAGGSGSGVRDAATHRELLLGGVEPLLLVDGGGDARAPHGRVLLRGGVYLTVHLRRAHIILNQYSTMVWIPWGGGPRQSGGAPGVRVDEVVFERREGGEGSTGMQGMEA